MKITIQALLLSVLSFAVNASTGGTCCPFSDEKLKENIQPLDNSLDKVLSLKGVSYTWRYKNKDDIGLIAQDVAYVYPELVTEKNGYKQVDYVKLIAPLIEAVREQQRQIELLGKHSAQQGFTSECRQKTVP